MKVELNHDEILASIIALEKEKPYRWRNSALRKLLSKMIASTEGEG